MNSSVMYISCKFEINEEILPLGVWMFTTVQNVHYTYAPAQDFQQMRRPEEVGQGLEKCKSKQSALQTPSQVPQLTWL